MIEVVNDKERNLKNLKQIGTPREDNKIYLENQAYQDIKEDTYKEKSVFVLMGHTERVEGRYATFIDAVIPVRDMEFSGNTPRWSNSIWSEVFREIKSRYDDMIIVGWAVDIRGMSPKVTPELERAHREHFGGVHQLLFLLDSLEQEESFFVYKENKLTEKDGFYIYHHARKKERTEPIPITVLPEKSKRSRRHEHIESHRNREPEVDVEVDIIDREPRKGGRYRQLMQEQKNPKPVDNGNLGLAIAVAMLVFVVGVGVYESRGNILGNSDSVETNLLNGQNESKKDDKDEEELSTQASADDTGDTETVGDDTETDVIPVEEITEAEE